VSLFRLAREEARRSVAVGPDAVRRAEGKRANRNEMQCFAMPAHRIEEIRQSFECCGVSTPSRRVLVFVHYRPFSNAMHFGREKYPIRLRTKKHVGTVSIRAKNDRQGIERVKYRSYSIFLGVFFFPLFQMTPLFNLSTNLHNGFRLAFFGRSDLERFIIQRDQFLLLLLLDLLLEIGFGYLLYLPAPEFQIYALPVYTFELGCFLITVWLIAKLIRRENAALQIGVVIYSLAPVLILLQTASRYLNEREFEVWPDLGLWIGRLAAGYLLILLGRALWLVCGRWPATAVGMMLVLLSAGPADSWFADYRDFWYPPEEQEEQGGDPYERYKALDVETLLYRQPALLDETLSRLRPQRNKHVDLFYVGFASFATEDVFSIEVDYIKRLFDERFGTKGHSVNLVNHLDTLEDAPLASATNLATALKRIGKIMNRDEDVLFLYLTSHGSSDHKLAVEFWPLPLNDITPQQLKTMLDEAGIKWRVIVVSACYSGAFVDVLKGPHTLVATAAAQDRTSFGCGSESDFTYFGEAVFKEQLQRQFSMISAFKSAAVSIAEREQREKLEASRPQLWVGKSIEPYLADMEKSLTHFQCGAERSETRCAE
jgi:hypothetical protein